MRLNLRRKAPAISAVLRGFRRLARAGRGLSDLQAAARLLNAQGYEAVRSLLDRLRVVTADAALPGEDPRHGSEDGR